MTFWNFVMKGIARTQEEIEFHDRIAQLGCISCRQEGHYNPHVSIHHAHGRTKPGCHWWVLPLCEPHHQDNGTAVARHPWKRRWEAKYGNEDDLIRQQWADLGVEFREPVRVAKAINHDRPAKPKPPKPPKPAEKVVEVDGVETSVAKAPVRTPKLPRVKLEKTEAQLAYLAEQKLQQAARNAEYREKAKPQAKDDQTRSAWPKRPAKPKPEAKSKIANRVAKPKSANASKIPNRAAAPKAPKSAKEIAFNEERKAAQKRFKDEQKLDMKAQAKAHKLAYEEANKDSIKERKDKAKAAQKKFRDEMAARKKGN